MAEREGRVADRYDVVVVGGGAGGLTAARDAHRRGASTLLVQSGPLGGDCTFTGCVPSKTLLSAAAAGEGWDAALARVHRTVATVAATEDHAALAREGIDTLDGWARVLAPDRIDVEGRRIGAGALVVATGATPLVPPIPGLDAVDHLTSDTVFDLPARPASMAILGGGPIGCELAQAFARLGVAVTLVEGDARLLPREEPAASEVVAGALRADGVDVRVGTEVVAVRDGVVGPVLEVDGGADVEAERLLVAVGRRPSGAGFGLEEVGVEVDRRGAVVTDDSMATAVDGIWAVGDVTGRLQLTHAAGRMAMVAVGNATGRWARVRPQRFDAGQVPWATFGSMFLYGVSYAVASLSCTVGPFLAATSTTFRADGVASGLGVFVAYALGMGAVVTVLTVAVALAREGFVARLRGALPYVTRVSGALLVVAGAYVAWYGWYEVRVLRGADGSDPIIDRGIAVQSWLQDRVLPEDPVVAVAVIALVVVAIAGLATWRARRRRPLIDPGPEAPDATSASAGPVDVPSGSPRG